ncbi:alkaline-phosphatase-like protein [Aspergillus alliaceus]|uniref:Alkaline-phosphatase-like protein n=1 Tax=Petromyces alliaceus TaxID=209559 RepID=A0A5N7BUS1_PETAA|nr:alkaline-phosphatase-like protein [Aspergillus alliaceus]
MDADYEFYCARLRTLQRVDETAEQVVLRLNVAGVLENTYIFYTSNKDIRVPMLIRGPGIPVGWKVDFVTTLVDLAPTIFEVARLEFKEEFDISQVPLTTGEIEEERSSRGQHEYVNVEYETKLDLKGRRVERRMEAQSPSGTTLARRSELLDRAIIYIIWYGTRMNMSFYYLMTDPYELNKFYLHVYREYRLTFLGYPIE